MHNFRYCVDDCSTRDWAIDQYWFSADKHSVKTSDPNRLYGEQFIMCLMSKVVTVIIETVWLVDGLESGGRVGRGKN